VKVPPALKAALEVRATAAGQSLKVYLTRLFERAVGEDAPFKG